MCAKIGAALFLAHMLMYIVFVAQFQQQLACERMHRGKQVDFVCKMHGFPQCVVKTSCKQSLIFSKN